MPERPKPTSSEQPAALTRMARSGQTTDDLIKRAKQVRAQLEKLGADGAAKIEGFPNEMPLILQRYYSGDANKRDMMLSLELNKRFATPPLLSFNEFFPEPGKEASYGLAQFNAQDGAASLTVEIEQRTGEVQFNFLLFGMVGARFAPGVLSDGVRAQMVSIRSTSDGVAFLWSEAEWQQDYLIFVVRERFARVYAFSAEGGIAACRLTPDGLQKFTHWLAGFWNLDTPSGPPADIEVAPDTW